jgi:regulator of sirC expression with transglutaminase-like and TPR domain
MLKHFNGADAELGPEDYRPVANREILLRLQNNLKLRDLRNGRLGHALLMSETMHRLAPERAGLLYEIGMLKVRLGDGDGAVPVLERFMGQATDAIQRRRAGMLLAELKEKMSRAAEEPHRL